MPFMPVAATNVPVWEAIVIAVGAAAIGFAGTVVGALGTQRAAERSWQAERRKLYAEFYEELFWLTNKQGSVHARDQDLRAQMACVTCYSNVMFAVKESHLREQLENLGPDAEGVSGINQEDLESIRAWLYFDLRPFFFRAAWARRCHRPPRFSIQSRT
jgi:hypothetical protein